MTGRARDPRPARLDAWENALKLHLVTGTTLLAAALGAQQLLAPLATAAGGGTTATVSTTTTATATTVEASSAACAEVGVVTVDGTGTGWGDLAAAGPVTGQVGRVLEREVGEVGGTTVQRHLGVDFAGVGALVPRATSTRPVADVVTRDRARAWRSGTSTARVQVEAELATMLEQCPEQAVVLAGESQGAGVVHRVLRGVEDDPSVAGRLAGAVLVSDPNRVGGTAATLLGEPRAPRAGAGVLTALTRGVADVPTPTQDIAVTSVCAAGDLVCDLGRSPVSSALAAHASYDLRPGRSAVRDAARLLAERTTAWPRVPEAQELVVHAGVAFREPVAVRVGAAYADGVVVSADHLPDGVSLSASGVLSGTLATPGTHDIQLRAHGSAPLTADATGTVVLTAEVPPASAAISGGGQSTCGVGPDGAAWCVGSNAMGQLGDGTNRDRADAVPVGQSALDWASIDTSGNVTCGVKQSGALYCWGANNRGQLGLGGGTQQWTPRQVGDSKGWAQVAVGWMHTCAVRRSGALLCWGEGNRGQLGDGGTGTRWSPERVGSAGDWVSVTTGGWHSCGVREDGSAWCWGLNDMGQLGIGATGWRHQPTRVDSSRSWVELDASWSSTCGRDAGGRLHCWGLNDQGQLGDGTRTTRFAPAVVAGDRSWTALSVGDAHACGLDRRGAAWCWGRNSYGQLGDGSSAPSVAPVAVAGEKTFTDLDAGWMHTCALTPGARVQCWGNNERGQLDRGDRQDRRTPPGVAVPAQRVVPLRAGSGVVATTFNSLGSQHTRPGGGAGTYAPARIRSEWTADLVRTFRSSFVGFQELQTDQHSQLRRSLDDRYAFYPGGTRNPRVVWQTVIWDKAQWQYVDSRIVDIPFLGKTRPNPMVRLRHLGTGKEVWVLNVHNVSRQIPSRQRERNQAVRIELEHVLAERDKGIPVVFLGDMNERETVFCKVTGQTDLRAVTGGSHSGDRCSPPARMHLDWIFASPELRVDDAEFDGSARVDRITDHHVLTSQLTLQ